ncbi:MAG: SPFH/Band 7/PHB domain protein, partial [Curtobacterium sp.]
LSGIAEGFTTGRSGNAPSAGGSAGGDFLERISKLANESLANSAAANAAASSTPRPDATAADIVPESDLDQRLAESDKSVNARLAAADEATSTELGDTK